MQVFCRKTSAAPRQKPRRHFSRVAFPTCGCCVWLVHFRSAQSARHRRRQRESSPSPFAVPKLSNSACIPTNLLTTPPRPQNGRHVRNRRPQGRLARRGCPPTLFLPSLPPIHSPPLHVHRSTRKRANYSADRDANTVYSSSQWQRSARSSSAAGPQWEERRARQRRAHRFRHRARTRRSSYSTSHRSHAASPTVFARQAIGGCRQELGLTVVSQRIHEERGEGGQEDVGPRSVNSSAHRSWR